MSVEIGGCSRDEFYMRSLQDKVGTSAIDGTVCKVIKY